MLINDVITFLNDLLYGSVLIVILLACGLFFSIRTGFVQIRLFREIFRVVFEKPSDQKHVSSLQALMVSTASRVGTGNIIGVSVAICIGGFGAMPWMWLIAILGAASAFAETTLAQIFKRKGTNGAYGGPAYYIEYITKSRVIPLLFVLSLMMTFGVGFNMIASYNVQDSFRYFSFYDPQVSPAIIGLILSILVGMVLLGGGKRIIKMATCLVPIMGSLYVLLAIVAFFMHLDYIPTVLNRMFTEAIDFQAIFGGFTGSCVMLGIKRALYSNEAGMGSAPNAAACAMVSHPVKQGLVQVLSVFIDTLFICSATAILCMSSGVEPLPELNGAPYIMKVAEACFGEVGQLLLAGTIILFAYTTIIANLFYVDHSFIYLFKTNPPKRFLFVYRIMASIIVFIGAILPSVLLWNIADLTMGLMALINIPCILLLSRYVVGTLKDYTNQKKQQKNPVFYRDSIGLEFKTDYWNREGEPENINK